MTLPVSSLPLYVCLPNVKGMYLYLIMCWKKRQGMYVSGRNVEQQQYNTKGSKAARRKGMTHPDLLLHREHKEDDKVEHEDRPKHLMPNQIGQW